MHAGAACSYLLDRSLGMINACRRMALCQVHGRQVAVQHSCSMLQLLCCLHNAQQVLQSLLGNLDCIFD